VKAGDIMPRRVLSIAPAPQFATPTGVLSPMIATRLNPISFDEADDFSHRLCLRTPTPSMSVRLAGRAVGVRTSGRTIWESARPKARDTVPLECCHRR